MATELIAELRAHGFSDPGRLYKLICGIDFRSVDLELRKQLFQTLEQIDVRNAEINSDLQRREISYLVQ